MWKPRAPRLSARSQTVVAPTSECRRLGLSVQALRAAALPVLTMVPRRQVRDLARREDPKPRMTAELTEVPIPTELVQCLKLKEVWVAQVRMKGELKLRTMKPVLTRSTSESPCKARRT